MYIRVSHYPPTIGSVTNDKMYDIIISASARISKGQGYQGFLRKRAGSSLAKKGQFASYKEKRTEFHSF
jgi:hypothetical protein